MEILLIFSMIMINCTVEEQQKLLHQAFHHPHPHVQKKMHVVHLRSQRFSQEQIMQAVGVKSKTTITTYCREWSEGGMERLMEVRFNKPLSKLKPFETDLKKHFEKYPPRSVKEAIAEIKKVTGIERKKSFVCDYLHQLGMKVRKVGSVPAKIDIKGQKQFKKNIWLLS